LLLANHLHVGRTEPGLVDHNFGFFFKWLFTLIQRVSSERKVLICSVLREGCFLVTVFIEVVVAL